MDPKAATPTPLDHLDDLAAQVDADTTGTLPDGTLIADQPEATDYKAKAQEAVDMFAGFLTGFAPATEAIWTDIAKTRVVNALAPVMEKYKVDFEALPCEVNLIIVAGPMLWQSSKLVALQMAKDKAEAAIQKAINKVGEKGAAAIIEGGMETPEQKRTPQEALYQ